MGKIFGYTVTNLKTKPRTKPLPPIHFHVIILWSLALHMLLYIINILIYDSVMALRS